MSPPRLFMALLSLSACASTTPRHNPEMLPAPPRLAIAPELRPLLESSDTVLLVRVKAGPWAQARALSDALPKRPLTSQHLLPHAATLRALVEQGPAHAMATSEAPPQDLEAALAHIDRTRDIYLQVTIATTPEADRMIAASNVMVTPTDAPTPTMRVSLYVPTAHPQKLLKALRRASWSERDTFRHTSALSTYAVLTHRRGPLVAASSRGRVAFRATPATVDFFNAPTLAAAYVRPEAMTRALLGTRLSAEVNTSDKTSWLARSLLRLLQTPGLQNLASLEFEDHSVSFRSVDEGALVLDTTSTRTNAGRALTSATSKEAIPLPTIELTPKQEEHIVLQLEGALNLGELRRHLNASKRPLLAEPLPPSFDTGMWRWGRFGSDEFEALARWLAHPTRRIMRWLLAYNVPNDLLAGRLHLWHRAETKTRSFALSLAIRGDEAAAHAALATLLSNTPHQAGFDLESRVEARPNGISWLTLTSSRDRAKFGAPAPLTSAHTHLVVNLEHIRELETDLSRLRLGSPLFGTVRASMDHHANLSLGRVTLRGESTRRREPKRWAFQTHPTAPSCRIDLTRTSQTFLESLSDDVGDLTNAHAALDDLDRAALTCITAHAAGAPTYHAVKANARWLLGRAFEEMSDRPNADAQFREACIMGAKSACSPRTRPDTPKVEVSQ